ncbi:hypothetical protein [Sporosarcina sp. G11-34]|uniref:hypothetical protein n=1 Tax=Sporosarcina sp. G11-34 TaxID=2849605 RepID=UPI0022A9B237|nr:hypothetical protein [Sporosarcina sp. G11-34]MCZ2257881.1 hypothetical protein [Sporosarcina sp. G11-34]
MENISIDEFIIKKYQEDEQVMIQLFVAWCINHNLDANKLYAKAYPEQLENPALLNVVAETEDTEKIEIEDETLLDVLQMFGNIELAFVVSDEIEKNEKRKN